MSANATMKRDEYREWCKTGTLPERLREVRKPAVTNLEPVDDSTAGETEIQAEIVRELRGMGFVAFHIPNGGKRRRIEAAILKGIGVLAGVADVCVLLPAGRCAWLEVKSDTGRPSEAQRRFARWCERLGHPYHVVRSVDTVRGLAETWERYDLGEEVA